MRSSEGSVNMEWTVWAAPRGCNYAVMFKMGMEDREQAGRRTRTGPVPDAGVATDTRIRRITAEMERKCCLQGGGIK